VQDDPRGDDAIVPINMDALDWLRKHRDVEGTSLLCEMVQFRRAADGRAIGHQDETLAQARPGLPSCVGGPRSRVP
jgi:hypothetical protein